MSEGTATDVEADELFVVTAGAGTVLIEAFDGAPETSLTLAPGSVVVLREGMRTTWTITSTLRKLWLAPADPAAPTQD